MLASFLAAVLVVAALVVSAMKLAGDAAEAEQQVVHTHEVLGALSEVRAATLQIELSTQSYRISGEPEHLAVRDSAAKARQAALDRLEDLTADNALQQTRLGQLKAVLVQRAAISRQIESLRKTQGAEAAAAFVARAGLKESRASVHQLLRDMDAEELALLEARNARQDQTRRVLLVMGMAAAAALFFLFSATYLLMRRQLREASESRHALAISEERLAVTLHSIGDAVIATDLEGRVTAMNSIAEQLTGWPLSEAAGRPIVEVFHIVHDLTREPAEIPVARVLATGEVLSLAAHTILLARDGTEWPIADSAAPIRDKAGGTLGVVLVFRDESMQREAQRVVRQQNELLEERVRERTIQLQNTESHFRNAISSIPAMIAYVDADQRYLYANQRYCSSFASAELDISGLTVREVLGDERYTQAFALIAEVMQGRMQAYDWQPSPDVWQAIQYLPRREPRGRVVGYYILGLDVTERKQAEAEIGALNAELELRVSELERVSRALQTLSAGNRAMLRAADEAELLSSMCEAIVWTGGYDTAIVWYRQDDEAKSLVPMAEDGFSGGLEELRAMKTTWADDEYGGGAVGMAIRSGESAVARDIAASPQYAKWRTHIPGKTAVMACPLKLDGRVIGALAIYDSLDQAFDPDEVKLLCESADDLAFGIATLRARDEQQRVEQAMYRLTRFDALTGLPNEAQFVEALSATLDASLPSDRPFALLQTNVERLADINATLGFGQGDVLLKEFGARLRRAAPDSAVVARLRGDEFALLLPDADQAGAASVVQSMENILAQPFPMADFSLDVSAQTGIVLFPDHGKTPHDLLRHMDIAVRQTHRRGERHALFDPALNQHQPSRLNMAGELRRAIDRGELRLHLQPKVELATGHISGVEGLVRWQHPERGLLPPGAFIDLAEQTGLIKPLTEWVINAALQLNQTWRPLNCSLPIAVNLSARNLRDGDLLDKVRQMLAASGIAPGLLELEITESTVMEDAAFSLGVLHSLRDEGIALYIDDFGTGYSSLSYLQKLPVDTIKIDQSFIHDMCASKEAATIVRSTIDLAHDLGRKTVAEGVETQAHWDRLSELGCDFAQGYFIAKPMPAADFQTWLRQFVPPLTGSAGS